ncbi:putative asparagine synthase [Mycena maculata]|uniref:Asparagine synthase n=1 Tax=Mycena maculata TaxID=230809 RepID=A0AAD7HSE9_9AGAR|nr:putative asparagine synthase [Mycena maculata]
MILLSLCCHDFPCIRSRIPHRPPRPYCSAFVVGASTCNMCGISVVCNNHLGAPQSVDELQKSLELIRHRGPDDTGIYVSPDGRIGLGHVRLAIIDVAHGKQPLSDETEAVHCVVNGELYDYASLRADLEVKGSKFKTDSDSELVLHLYKHYGLSLAFHLRGEFAFVLYDSTRRLILAARDRFGIKPLYYTQVNGQLLLASEIKAFLPFGFKAAWNVESIVHQGEYADDRTIFRGVYKIPPGHYLTYDRHNQLRVVTYWDHSFLTQGANVIHHQRSIDDAIAAVRQLVVNSVRIRLRSDVPFAVNLSGGIDSAAIAGIASAALKERDPNARLDVFTLAFPDRQDVDEAPVARRMAESVGAIMHVVRPTEEELVAEFEPSVWYSEAPLIYLHGAGKILLSKAVRERGFKVVLSGEGADELFGGYNYLLPDYLRQPDTLSSDMFGLALPTEPERQAILQAITTKPRAQDHVSLSPISLTDSQLAREMLGGLITHRVIGITGPPHEYFSQRVLEEHGKPEIARSISEFFPPHIREEIASGRWHSLHGALYVVQKTALGNIILNHLGDRPEMANSVEGRPPFLDHKLVEYVNTLPASLKIRPFLSASKPQQNLPRSWNFIEKWVLREAVRPFVTEEIYNIKKSMYNSPIPPPTSTLAGRSTPLQAHLAARITKEAVDQLGFLRWETVKATLAEFMERPESPADGGLDPNARRLLYVLSFIVLREKFQVPKYTTCSLSSSEGKGSEPGGYEGNSTKH